MPTLTFDPSNGPSDDQLTSEATALEQGELLAQAAEEDRARLYDQRDSENQDVSLIGGKFKSQDELLKAYKELESKLGKKGQDEEEEALEEPTETSNEVPEQEEQPSETVEYMTQLSKEYEQNGQLSEEAIDRLSQMDPKELIQSYLQFYQKSAQQQQQATIEAATINQIKQSVGGDATYTEMTQWAADNLNSTEISEFNTITNSGNPIAIKFAVEALYNRYRAAEGYEAPLVTGGKSSNSGFKPYRSQAELARDIADPRYSSDPAFRQDVEDRLSISQDLL